MMNPWSGLNKLPKEVWIIAITTLINRAGTMVFPFLVFYFAHINFSIGKTSFLLALFGIGSLVTAPVSGWLSDRVGALQVMKLSLVLSGSILLIYHSTRNFPLVALLTLLWAITSESFRPASFAILTTVVRQGDGERARRDRKAAQALSRLAINLGMVIGPLFAALLVKHGLWRSLFRIDGATSILAFVYLSVMLRPAKFQDHGSKITKTEDAIISIPSSRAIQDRGYLYFLLAIIPLLMVFFQEFSALPQYMKMPLKLDEAFYGYLLAVNAVLVIAFELYLNNVTGDWSYRRSLTWGALLCAVGFGALAFANSFAFLVATVVVWTFGEMLLLPNLVAYVGSIAPKDREGEYMGLYSMVFSLSLTLAPSIGMMTLQKFGGGVLWSAAFVLAGFSAIMISRLTQVEKYNPAMELNS
jgi:predicted MFS family arabinose efflux permease